MLQGCSQTCAALISEQMSVKAEPCSPPSHHAPLRLPACGGAAATGPNQPNDASAPVNVLHASVCVCVCGLLVVLRVFYLLAVLRGKTEKKHLNSSFWSCCCHGELKLNLDAVTSLRRAFTQTAQLSLSLVFAKMENFFGLFFHIFRFIFNTLFKRSYEKKLTESEKNVCLLYLILYSAP